MDWFSETELPTLAGDKARRRELHPGLLCGWQEPRTVSSETCSQDRTWAPGPTSLRSDSRVSASPSTAPCPTVPRQRWLPSTSLALSGKIITLGPLGLFANTQCLTAGQSFHLPLKTPTALLGTSYFQINLRSWPWSLVLLWLSPKSWHREAAVSSCSWAWFISSVFTHI